MSDKPWGVEEASRPFITFDDFERMDEAGRFGDRSRLVELIQGRLVEMPPTSNDHLVAASNVYDHLRTAFAASRSQLRPWSGGTVKIGVKDGPLPDVVVATERLDGKYLTPNEVRLVVEVSVSTLTTDLGVKQRIYASAGIAEYWVVDVRGRRLHQMTEPAETGAYERIMVLEIGDFISPICAPEIRIALRDLF